MALLASLQLDLNSTFCDSSACACLHADRIDLKAIFQISNLLASLPSSCIFASIYVACGQDISPLPTLPQQSFNTPLRLSPSCLKSLIPSNVSVSLIKLSNDFLLF